jgi:acetyl esterase
MDSEVPEKDALDPDLAAVFDRGRLADLPPWHTMTVTEARRVEDDVFSSGVGPAVDSVVDSEIAGPSGDLPIRLYRPQDPALGPSGDTPALVFFHGGGFVLGTLDSADDVCRQFATRLGAVVVSVDYRLAPEHPFPAAVEDAWAALQWVGEEADEEGKEESLGIDPGRVGVAGTSAGGALAAAVGLRARAEGVPLAVQVLCYPMLDPEATATADVEDRAAAPLLSRADVDWFWDQFLPDRGDASDPLAAPARADTLEGCPSTVVTTAGHDVLRFEGAAFAERLEDSGVPTTYLHYPTLAHGFLSLAGDVEAARTATAEVTAAVRDCLDPTPD